MNVNPIVVVRLLDGGEGEVVGGGGGGVGKMWEGAKILKYRDRFSLHHCNDYHCRGVVTTIHVLPKATGSAPSPANCRYPLAKTYNTAATPVNC